MMKTSWRTLVVAENAAGEALAAGLRADGHHVDIARSGLDAIDRARDRQYLTYFISFEVAGMDGIEIMKENSVRPAGGFDYRHLSGPRHPPRRVRIHQRAAAGQASDLHPMTLADMEKLLITATLRHTGGNIKESATLLYIDRSTLYEKIKKFGMPR
jgi:DNA-binding NtrC family response regulator